MYSTRAGEARPVRTPRSSFLRYSRAFSMCSSVSRRIVSGSVIAWAPTGGWDGRPAALGHDDSEGRVSATPPAGGRYLGRAGEGRCPGPSNRMQESADLFATSDASDVAAFLEVKDHDGHLVLGAHGQGRHVHDAQPLVDGLGEGDRLVTHRRGVFLGISGIDPVHLRGLQEHVATELGRPQGRPRVGREVRVAGPESGRATWSGSGAGREG